MAGISKGRLLVLAAAVVLLLQGVPVPAAAAEPPFELQAGGAVLMDAVSGQVLFEKNPHQPFAPASVTKIMTLILLFDALEAGKVSMDQTVAASANAVSHGGSQIWLEQGEEMTVRELAAAVAIGSANDAAVALAEHVGGSEELFVRTMNEKARELGMKNTRFMNPHGLDEEGHETSAYDVALMSRYAVRFPGLLSLTSTWEEYLREGKTWLVNFNRLLKRYPGVDGLKTGSTDRAGFAVSVTARRDGTRLIAVIMKAPNSAVRFDEAAKLLAWGFASYTSVPIYSQGDVVERVTVHKGTSETLDLVAPRDFGVTVRRGEEGQVEKEVMVKDAIVAPLAPGDALGEVVVRKGEEEIARMELVAAHGVKRLGLGGMIWRTLGRFVRLYR